MVFCREHGSDHEIKVAPRVTLVLDRTKILSKTSFFYDLPKSMIWRATWHSHSYGFAFAVRFVSESLTFFGQKGNVAQPLLRLRLRCPFCQRITDVLRTKRQLKRENCAVRATAGRTAAVQFYREMTCPNPAVAENTNTTGGKDICIHH